MKNLAIKTSALFLTILSLFACEKTNNLSTVRSVDDVIEEMRQTKLVNRENAIFANIKYDSQTGNILEYDIKEKEFDLIFIPFTNEPVVQSRADTYKVSCSKKVYTDNQGNSTDETECSGSYSCGTAIKKCLDAGGCAEICSAIIVWVPSDDELSPYEGELLITPAE
jgi:hypothetical protein